MASGVYSWILPREALAGTYDAAKTVIGSGPFTLESFTPDVAYVYKKNPDWWEQGRPYVDGVRRAIIPQAAQRLAQFTGGQLHLMTSVPATDLDTAKQQNPKAEVFMLWDAGGPMAYFQLGDATSPFQDVRLRRAVSMAIDRAAFGKIHLNNQYQPSFNAPLSLGKWSLGVLVERAGASTENIARVSLYLKQLSDLQAVNSHWVAMFPNAEDRPSYKFLQVNLPDRWLIELDFLAVAGGRRKLLAIEGVAHTNPIPLAVKIGPMLFSSRILPSDVEKGQYGDTPERQAELSFRHARRLVEMAGGAPGNICQIRAFVKEPGFRVAIEEQVRQMFPGGSVPPVEILHYPSAGPLQAMIEIIAGGLPAEA